MNRISCVIIDDEPIACQGMQEYISQVDFLSLRGIFNDGLSAYDSVNGGSIQLLFLDIEMPGINGIGFIRSLKSIPYVIFTTAYPNYALDGFELGVVDYLLKPIAFPRFLKAANKARDLINAQTENNETITNDDDSFFVKENGKFLRIHYNEVLYAEGLQNYVAIHLAGRKIISYVTMTILETQLPQKMFMRVHKSYIVALNKISSIDGNIILIGKHEIPVSRNMRELLMQQVVAARLLKR